MYKILSKHYLAGLFETDGSFQILFKKDKTMNLHYRLFPVAIFTQANIEIIQNVYHSLVFYNIQCKKIVVNNEKTNLTSSVEIQGIKNVKSFLDFLDLNKIVFLSIKYIDYLYFSYLYLIMFNNFHNTINGRKLIIDIKFHLHTLGYLSKQNNYLINDKENKSTLNRKIWENRHKLPENIFIFAAQNYVAKAHKNYYCNLFLINEKIKNKSLRLNPSYIAGILEGDGSISVFIENNKKSKKTIPRFTIRICVYSDIYSRNLLQNLAYFFNDENPYIKSLHPQKKAFVYVLRRKTIHTCINFLKKYPIIASQGKLAVFISNVLEKNYNNKFHHSRKIAKMIYLFSNTRKKRKKNLNTVIRDFQMYYNT